MGDSLLIGAYIVDGDGRQDFCCDDCLKSNSIEIREPLDTPVYDDDRWFGVETCAKCGSTVD